MKATDLDKTICLRYCHYYKPNKNEELECFGFTIIERLINKGIKIYFKDFQHTADNIIDEELIQTICVICPFSQEDCDFFVKKTDAKPCGGISLLGYLIDSHSISIKDIKDVI